MREELKIALNNNPFKIVDFDRYPAVFAQMELLGYSHKEIRKVVNAHLKEKGIAYKFSKKTINEAIGMHEITVHLSMLRTAEDGSEPVETVNDLVTYMINEKMKIEGQDARDNI